jgi:anti-sigma-K factor RskA
VVAQRVRPRVAASGAHARRRPVARWRRPALAAAAVLVVGVGYTGERLLRPDPPPGGVVEYAGPMTAPDGSVAARVTVEKVGIGRVVSLDSDALPILPTGELYELWFVGPADVPGAPDRISAGTFHPDERGRSSVRLVAAVDPALYPRMVVTAEPSGGDPAPNGPDVLEATISAE